MANAGRQLYQLITSRGGSDSEYADLVYGIVISTKPLKVQLSNQMVLDENFLILGKHIGKFKLQGKAHIKGKAEVTGSTSTTVAGHSDTIGDHTGSRPTVTESMKINSGTVNFDKADLQFPKKDFYIEFDNRLEVDDHVTLFRCDGGQKFYLFERQGKDGFGF